MIEIKSKGDQKIEIDGITVQLTNLDKTFFPEDGHTKGDLLQYYADISSYLLPYLSGRPESLHRFPNGIHGKSFYQKDMDHLPPEWADTIEVVSEEGNKKINYLICNNLPTLLYIINLGCIDLNPWNSRRKYLDRPDYLVIDLDPEDISFDFVLRTAMGVREVLSGFEILSYPKTSGATGIHIYIPLGAEYSYEQTRHFAEILVSLVHEKFPEFTSLERSPAKRQQKVYLDYLQNAKGQTLAAPYSVRPRPRAPVSAPLTWAEIERGGFTPEDFNMKNILERITKNGDLFEGVLGSGVDIGEIIDKLR